MSIYTDSKMNIVVGVSNGDINMIVVTSNDERCDRVHASV